MPVIRSKVFLAGLCTFALAGCLEPGEPHLQALDTVAPQLVETTPDAESLVDPEGEILVTFSERMEPRSLNAGLWLQAGNERLATRVEIPPEPPDVPQSVAQQRPQPYTVRVKWDAPLASGAVVTLVLDTVLIDLAGNVLEGPDGGNAQRRLTFRTP